MKGKKKYAQRNVPILVKLGNIGFSSPTGDQQEIWGSGNSTGWSHHLVTMGGRLQGVWVRLQSLKFHVSKTELTFVFTIPQVSGTPWIPLTAPLPRPPTEPTSVPSCHSLPFAQAPHPLQFQVPLNTGIRGAVPLPVKNLHVTWPSPNLTNSLLLTGSHWAHIMYAL